jgi:hypothetical protein
LKANENLSFNVSSHIFIILNQQKKNQRNGSFFFRQMQHAHECLCFLTDLEFADIKDVGLPAPMATSASTTAHTGTQHGVHFTPYAGVPPERPTSNRKLVPVETVSDDHDGAGAMVVSNGSNKRKSF